MVHQFLFQSLLFRKKSFKKSDKGSKIQDEFSQCSVIFILIFCARDHEFRLRFQLTCLDGARNPEDMNAPGWKLHPLKEGKPSGCMGRMGVCWLNSSLSCYLICSQVGQVSSLERKDASAILSFRFSSLIAFQRSIAASKKP